MAKIITPINFAGGSEIAKNSLALVKWDLLTIKSGFVDKAVAGDKVEGIYIDKAKTFASNNQTVGKEKVEFARLSDDFIIEVDVANGTISQANIGASFNLNASGLVDGATAGTGTQLTLRKVVDNNTGWFVRAK